nr:MAG TPA: hypothetical protein [Caudoviricetes sp.]
MGARRGALSAGHRRRGTVGEVAEHGVEGGAGPRVAMIRSHAVAL